MNEIASLIGVIKASAEETITICDRALERIAGLSSPRQWSFPVGSDEYPPERWYCATVHDLSGRLNGGYKHTGIDLNVDQAPYGDVDRGQPVFAVADGVIQRVHYSQQYLGSIVLEIVHDGKPLFVRYWHLEKTPVFQRWAVGQTVASGQLLGILGNYEVGAGGDHLHFDMALDVFDPHWWHTNHPEIRWVDPVPILKAHLDTGLVEAMLRKGG
jgi:murein DD-endopeptidase MepM/ murein hydrolase activator NlpD